MDEEAEGIITQPPTMKRHYLMQARLQSSKSQRKSSEYLKRERFSDELEHTNVRSKLRLLK